VFPVFRDRSELASSTNLSQSILSALDDSEALIVICSPESARSHWVNEEICHFRQTFGSSNIHCLITSGSPDRGSPDCAFPRSILEDTDGHERPEPLAADIRDSCDGKRGSLLKIAAGLLGVGIDDLRQRDAQSRLRRRSFIAALALTVSAITLVFAVFAHLARQEAELRREQGEELISFMLGDLRSRLEPMGRLDILDAVGEQSSKYFSALGNHGSAVEVLSRVMSLRQIGEVLFRQGRLAQAQQSFTESRDLASQLYDGTPEDEGVLFELGQAEFWVGYAALEQGDSAQAYVNFNRYLDYSKSLSDRFPSNLDYQQERSYALRNLGTLALERGNSEESLELFQGSLAVSRRLLAELPGDTGLIDDLGGGYSWLGASYFQLGNLSGSLDAYLDASRILETLHFETKNPLHTEHYAQVLSKVGQAYMVLGSLAQAEREFSRAGELMQGLVMHDGDNAIWLTDESTNRYFIGELQLARGEDVLALQNLLAAQDGLLASLNLDPGDVRALDYLGMTRRAIALQTGDESLLNATYLSLRNKHEELHAVGARSAITVALLAEAYGGILTRQNKRGSAEEIWRTHLEQLQSVPGQTPHLQAVQALLMTRLEIDESAKYTDRLSAIGYRDPRFTAVDPT
jgi:tetratricopeptide (TPR) repeat protein